MVLVAVVTPKTTTSTRVGRLVAPIFLVALVAVINFTDWIFPVESGGSATRGLAKERQVVLNSKPFDPRRVCHQNPYVDSLDTILENISTRMDSWLDKMETHYQTASAPEMRIHNHARFFPFEATAGCKATSCVGGPCRQDASKIVCGLDQLKQDCVVYSIGGNNDWEFENDVLAKTPCHVHTFDCTGSIDRFKKPDNDRLHFHHVCLGTIHEDAVPEGKCKGQKKCGETWTLLEIQQRLNHMQVDLFKIDIEGYEWPLFESWPEIADTVVNGVILPMQILVELHYRTQFAELRRPGTNDTVDFKSGEDMVNLQAHLLRMGYVVVERDNNGRCKHCTELTLIRSRCQENLSPYPTSTL